MRDDQHHLPKHADNFDRNRLPHRFYLNQQRKWFRVFHIHWLQCDWPNHDDDDDDSHKCQIMIRNEFLMSESGVVFSVDSSAQSVYKFRETRAKDVNRCF